MSAVFGRVIKQVFTTFDQRNISAFKNNFLTLKQLVDQLSAKDLNIGPDLMSEEAFNKQDKAPCTYIHIFQNEDVAMSVFILQANYTMPLHDHPMMHGILKGLSGTLLVQSYTKIMSEGCSQPYVKSARTINVRAEPSKVVTSASESAVLTPADSNFHEITAIGGVAAFFDILSPPYEAEIPIYGKRKCNFYVKLPEINLPGEFLLRRIPAPLSYFCDTEEYDMKILQEYLCEYKSANT